MDIGSRGQINMKTGDRCVIHTPGGGGWGVPRAEDEMDTDAIRVDKADGPAMDKADGPLLMKNGAGSSQGKVPYPRAAGGFHSFSAAQEASQ